MSPRRSGASPYNPDMRITLNGRPSDVEGEPTIAMLLDEQGLAQTPCAVEVNREVVPKPRHADHRLADGDVVEIVTLVGGG